MATKALLLSRTLLQKFNCVSKINVINRNVLASKNVNGILKTFLCTSTKPLAKKEWYEVTYERADGVTFTVKGKDGDNLLDIAINNDIDLEGFGACEGTLACSTCHLVFNKEDFDNIEEPVTDEELDMLDLAYGLQDTSRLGCQVCLTKKLNGIKVKVPEGTADARSM